MTSELEPAGWHVVVGTARGAVHYARGMPNQDSAEYQADAETAATVVAVADGHGHSRHARSAIGSALAVQVSCRVAAQFAGSLASQPAADGAAEAAREHLPLAIVREWRGEVAKHLSAHPYTESEQAALAEAGDEPEVPYGSTLLVAVIAGRWLACAQIGDGDVIAVRPDGTALCPVPGDSRLDGQHTTSLCQPDAEDDFRTAAHDLSGEPLLALLVATDGFGNAQSSASWQGEVARDIVALAAEHDHGWFAVHVPDWAERCASADGSGDDTTIALLLAPDSAELAVAARREAARLAAAPAAERVPTVPSEIPVPTVPSLAPVPTIPSVLPDQVAPVSGSAASGPAASASAASAPAATGPAAGRPGRARHGAARHAAARRRWIGVLVAVVVLGALAAAVTMLVAQPSGGHPASPAPGNSQAPIRNAPSDAASPQPGRSGSPQPRGRQPASAVPSSGPANGDAPTTQAPTTREPTTREPTTREPTTGPPATGAPGTEAPGTATGTSGQAAGQQAAGGQQRTHEGD